MDSGAVDDGAGFFSEGDLNVKESIIANFMPLHVLMHCVRRNVLR